MAYDKIMLAQFDALDGEAGGGVPWRRRTGAAFLAETEAKMTWETWVAWRRRTPEEAGETPEDTPRREPEGNLLAVPGKER